MYICIYVYMYICIHVYMYICIDSLLRRLIILSLSFPYRLDRQLLLRCNAMINIPGKGSVPYAVCCA